MVGWDVLGGGIVRRFLCDLERADGLDDAVDVLHGTIQELGFPQLIFGRSKAARLGDGRWSSPPLIVRRFPSNWDRDWARHSPNDPYFHSAVLSMSNVDWRTVQAGADQLDQAERDCMSYVSDLGVTHGYTVRIRTGDRRCAFVTAIGEPRRGSWEQAVAEAGPILTLVAHYFYSDVLHRFKGGDRAYPSLSRREGDCLQLAAQGKTVEETSIILDISSETVRIYFKRINAKLNVTNRAHAVARALSLGIIDSL